VDALFAASFAGTTHQHSNEETIGAPDALKTVNGSTIWNLPLRSERTDRDSSLRTSRNDPRGPMDCPVTKQRTKCRREDPTTAAQSVSTDSAHESK
jgi:hypothetical protein